MNIVRILGHLYPNAEYVVQGGTYEGLTWIGPGDKPSEEYLISQSERVALEIFILEANNHRRAAYVEEADPLFFEWQSGEGTEEAWLAKRQEIRERFPYPEVVE